MPTKPLASCTTPSCPERVSAGACARHRAETQRRLDETRGSAASRGYDRKWAANSARFLKAHPTCIDCGAPATVPDHDPVSRRELVARGDPNPDAWRHLKPRCTPCHSRRTALEDGRWTGGSR